MYLLLFSICLALILSTGFLHRYGNIPRQHPLVTVSVLMAWSFSFLIVFTIPLDITAVSSQAWWITELFCNISPHTDRLSPMFIRTPHQRHRCEQFYWLPKTLGNGLGRCLPQSLENHLLDIAISHLAHHATNAILPQGWRLSCSRKAEIGSHRQRNILRNIFVHLRLPPHIHCPETRSHSGLAETQSHRIISI